MNKSLVLDTNILFRAVFGVKVPALFDKYKSGTDFFTTDICYDELEKYAYPIGQKRDVPAQSIRESISKLRKVVRSTSLDVYVHKQDDAMARIGDRDPDDWHLVALALTLDSAIWTEDKDFFGIGLSTWNSRNVEIFLRQE